jgi:hypothetical protein
VASGRLWSADATSDPWDRIPGSDSGVDGAKTISFTGTPNAAPERPHSPGQLHPRADVSWCVPVWWSAASRWATSAAA